MNKFLSSLVVAFFLILFLSCNKYVDQSPVMSFCYWKTSFSVDSVDAAKIRQLGVNHFYLRLFDVDWDAVTQRPTPVGECERSFSAACPTDITPTVFITNAVFQNISEEALDDFASKMAKKINVLKKGVFDECLDSRITNTARYSLLYEKYEWSDVQRYKDSLLEIIKPEFYQTNNEILIDCDWTPSTKAKYFSFLEKLKEKMEAAEVSSTLRLWQYRDYKLAGVPPVKRCLLMCYNLTDPRKYETENSIATTEEFRKYITHSDYPLKLDIALPIHTWAVYFRNNAYKGIVTSISNAEITTNKTLFEKKSEQKYMFLKDTVINETYYRYGDEFRVEQVDFKTLLEFSRLIKQYIHVDAATRLSFFSWDAQYYNRFTNDEYKQIRSAIFE